MRNPESKSICQTSNFPFLTFFLSLLTELIEITYFIYPECDQVCLVSGNGKLIFSKRIGFAPLNRIVTVGTKDCKRLERRMLRAMDELEKSVTDLMDRLKNQADLESGSGKSRPDERDERAGEREQEAADLVRRAITRLKSL